MGVGGPGCTWQVCTLTLSLTHPPTHSHPSMQVPLIDAGFFVGFWFGALVAGPISDRWGRRTCLLGDCLASAAACAATAAAPSALAYGVLRVLTGAWVCVCVGKGGAAAEGEAQAGHRPRAQGRGAGAGHNIMLQCLTLHTRAATMQPAHSAPHEGLHNQGEARRAWCALQMI